MLHFLRRFAWNNLSIRAKTGVLFIAQLALIGVLALISFLSLTTVSNRTQQVSEAASQARGLTRKLQLEAAALQSIEVRLFENPDFNPEISDPAADFAEQSQMLRMLIRDLEGLSGEVVDPSARKTLESEIANLEVSLARSEDAFKQMVLLAGQLAAPETGALSSLNRHAERLEAQIFSEGNSALINELLLLESREHIFRETGSEADLLAVHEAADSLLLAIGQPSSTSSSGIPEVLDLYMAQVDGVAELYNQMLHQHLVASSLLNSVRGSASRLDSIVNAQVALRLQAIETIRYRTALILAISLGLALVTSGGLSYLFAQSLNRSVYSLLEATKRLEAGEFHARAELRGQDEFSQLALSFNAMALQLEGLIGGLEQRVAERTRDLSITAEIGQAVVAQHDPRDLMNEVVELIRERFGFYHAQVFLIDDKGENAVLVASTGPAGRELLARRHSLPVGSRSVIGQVTARNEPVIALDTDVDQVHRRNELLPDTRSEMALPMRIGDRVIGALDVQSVAPNAFDVDHVAVFQIMADQLAMALENARLHNRLAEAMENLQSLQQRMVSREWRSFWQRRQTDQPLVYQLEDTAAASQQEVPSNLLDTAIEKGCSVRQGVGNNGIDLAVPIRVRGAVIGAFGFSGEALRDLSEDDMALIEAVVDRVGLALENLRLLEESSRRTQYEHIVNEITAKIVGLTDVDLILQTTVQELGRVLRAPQTSVQLRHENLGGGGQ